MAESIKDGDGNQPEVSSTKKFQQNIQKLITSDSPFPSLQAVVAPSPSPCPFSTLNLVLSMLAELCRPSSSGTAQHWPDPSPPSAVQARSTGSIMCHHTLGPCKLGWFPSLQWLPQVLLILIAARKNRRDLPCLALTAPRWLRSPFPIPQLSHSSTSTSGFCTPHWPPTGREADYRSELFVSY